MMRVDGTAMTLQHASARVNSWTLLHLFPRLAKTGIPFYILLIRAQFL